MMNKWSPKSWRTFTALQQPEWPDKISRDIAFGKISKLPALVFAGETRSLKNLLALAMDGDAFILQGGDCSEDFNSCHGPMIHNLLNVILQMAVIISYGGEKQVVKIGRIAGQYAKPRSSLTEIINNIEIPSYRGDMINSPEPTVKARTPDPQRVLEGYFRSAATLNLVRAFTTGGYASINQIQNWLIGNFEQTSFANKYRQLISGIEKTINFTLALGTNIQKQQLNNLLYTSHEALLLEYEEVMTRIDTTTGLWYDTSAHMLWIGDRTRQPEGAHVEFLSGVCNPIGVKVGPNYNIDELKKVADKINPQNDKGRLTFITRFGSEKINKFLPLLVNEMNKEGYNILWVCDPMHGNTFNDKNTRKTRKFEHISKEIQSFIQITKSEGSIPGGVHLELTGEKVTECVGGSCRLAEDELEINYQTNCDPRLNVEQAVEIAFEIAEMINPN